MSKINKFRIYQKLQMHSQEILAEMKKQADDIGIPKDLRGKIGLGGGSGNPPTLPEDVLQAIHTYGREVVPLAKLVDEIRDIVKDVYGDGYDAAPVSTAEAALWVSFDTLVSPPFEGRGENYRPAYIAPYERHIHHQGGYGRPFPPKYKDLVGDRGSTAGELGVYAKRLCDLDTIIVPLEGATYDAHGIKYHPVPILNHVDSRRSAERIARVAERHASRLGGFASLGYDTLGYGYSEKETNGAPMLQRMIGKLAAEYDVPYICDNARGLPFIGTDPRKNLSDIILYSMDKAAEAPTSGLIIGKEDVMVPVRKALGYHGSRGGTVSTYGKAGYVMADPGKEALTGMVVALKKLRDRPDEMRKRIDEMYKIVKQEFETFSSLPDEGIHVTKSENGAAVEVNYSDTWTEDVAGIPIFSIEDMYAGSNLIQVGLPLMGINTPLAYDANVFLVMGQGNVDGSGNLLQDRVEFAVRGVIRAIEIVKRWAESK